MLNAIKRLYWRYEIRSIAKSVMQVDDLDSMNALLSDIRYALAKLDRLL